MYREIGHMGMKQSYDYDAIVIGSGPGGEGAAMAWLSKVLTLLLLNAITISVVVVRTGGQFPLKLYVTLLAVSSSSI